jgi:hypothetical protein
MCKKNAYDRTQGCHIKERQIFVLLSHVALARQDYMYAAIDNIEDRKLANHGSNHRQINSYTSGRQFLPQAQKSKSNSPALDLNQDHARDKHICYQLHHRGKQNTCEIVETHM